jgi:hypothetical protein
MIITASSKNSFINRFPYIRLPVMITIGPLSRIDLLFLDSQTDSAARLILPWRAPLFSPR